MKKSIIIVSSIVVILIIVRLILPSVVLHYTNGKLAHMKGYYGEIHDIDLSLFRGAYTINTIYLNKIDSVTQKQTEFFKARTVDLSVEWPALLLHGSIVGKMVFESPELIFTKNKTELSDVKRDTSNFRTLLDDFMPLKVNRVETHDGTVRYIDNGSKPKLDISLTQAHILALNLSSVVNKTDLLPSTIVAQATVYEGTIKLNMKLNALADVATFDLNAEINNTNLVLINDLFMAYGNFDVSGGNFGLYTEMAAKDGRFKGYVKPVIRDLKVLGPDDRKDSFLHKIWESLVGVAGVVFKNQKSDQLATKIRMEGKFQNPRTSTFDAVWEVMRNAFIQALIPNVDNEIDINSVKSDLPDDKRNFIQKIFIPK